MSTNAALPQSFTLRSSKCEVEISSLAGFPTSWKVGPQQNEILGTWLGSNGSLSSGFPMFPVIGQIGEDGVIGDEKGDYTPGKHGFCRKTLFKAKMGFDNVLTLSYAHDPATKLGLYPYACEIELTYRLVENELTIQTFVRNAGKNRMAFGCGLHPAFAMPVEGSVLSLVTALPEKTKIYRPIQGVLRDGHYAKDPFRNLSWKLSPKDFKDDAYFFLTQGAPQISMALQSPQGRKLALTLDGWGGFGVWSKPEKPDFICIEPLTGASLMPMPRAPKPTWQEALGLAHLEPLQNFCATTKIKVLGI
jgi:galactose mutarotase-like enzyme